MATPTIDSGKAIRFGWTAIQKDFWYLVSIAVVSSIITGVTNSPRHGPNNWDFLGLLLSAWMTCGYTVMMLSYQTGKKLPFVDLFTQFKHFFEVLGATLLVGLIVAVGFIFLIVPGIYLALRFQFTVTLILDRNLGIMEAMRESTKLTQGIKMSLLGFDLTLLGVILLGVLALGVGVFVAMPIVWLATVVVYRQLSGAHQTGTPVAASS